MAISRTGLIHYPIMDELIKPKQERKKRYMKKQRRPNAYDRGQHQLICEVLGVSEDPGAPGRTAFEAVCELIQHLPPKRQKDLEARVHQLMRAEILGRLSKVLRDKAFDSWLHNPNRGFDNQKPIDMLDSGQFEPLLRMLDWLGAKSLP